MTKDIASLQAKINNPPPEPEPQSAIDADLERNRREGVIVREAIHEIQESLQRLSNDEHRAKNAITQAEQLYVRTLLQSRLVFFLISLLLY